MGKYPKAELQRLVALNDGLSLGYPESKRLRYVQQMGTAKRRGVAWEITFEEWVMVWNESGKWHQRGMKKGQYVMARNGDVGPYSVANVTIIRAEQNVLDALLNRPKTFGIGNQNRLGTGSGVRFKVACKSRPYQAVLRQKSLGYYATFEEARAVHVAALAEYITTRDTATPNHAYSHPLTRVADAGAQTNPKNGSAYLVG